MATFLRSFVEAIAPSQEIPSPVRKAPESKGPQTATSGGGLWPRQPRTEPALGLGSRVALEWPVDDHEVEVEELESDSKEDQWDQRNPLDPGDLGGQITVRRPALTPTPHPIDQTGPEDSESPQSWIEEESMSRLDTGDLLEDAKFYQDVAIELQSAYDNLQYRYAQQARLIEKASGALHAAETQASKRQWELSNVQKDHEANVQLAVGEAVFEYREQLTMAKRTQQLKDHEYKQTVHKLQDQVRTLELSLAGHATLPSLKHTQKDTDLWEEVFNYLPGTVNTKRGAAMYDTQDQPFSFRKHVQFGDRSQVPDLKLDADSEDQPNIGQDIPHSSTPHRGAKPISWTFDISHIPPMTGSPQDAAAIAAEVSAAVAAQVLKEFHWMQDPKLPSSRADIWLMPN